MLLLIYPDLHNAIYPLVEVRVDDDGRNWTVPSCDIGGRTGERRVIGFYLVGPAGRALFRYYREAAKVHNETNNLLQRAVPETDIKHLPLILERTHDMIKCAEVLVIRE
jgi:hypothetical protein